MSMEEEAKKLRANWNYPTAVRFGVGRIAELPEACKAAGMKKPLLVTDPGLAKLPMIEEAQWDVPRTNERRAVTACLRGQYGHEKVLASMGSLAHYMQELSREGFRIADFIHEGNGELWALALSTGPAPHAGWMLVEEQSEGGDVLARRARDDVRFTSGMDRICAAGGVALYRRR